MKNIILLPLIAVFLVTSKFGNKTEVVAERKWTATNRMGEAKVGAPNIVISDMRIVEGNAGLNIARVMVSISQVMPVAVSVAYSTRNLTAVADSDYVPARGSVTFVPGEMMKRVDVSIIGEVICEEDEKFEIVLSDASGATIDGNAGTVTIVNDDCRSRSTNSSGTVTGGNLSIYEVRLTHTGYTTFGGTPADCPIRSNGKVVLSGLLAGYENVPEDDDIRYTGTLQLDIDIDICSSKTVEDPGGGYPPCGMTVTGSGAVKVELEIYFDGRGGYIKINNESGRFNKRVTGSCDNRQIDEERVMVPVKTIATIFNGRDLPMLTDRTLRVGRYVETERGNETVVEVLRAVR